MSQHDLPTQQEEEVEQPRQQFHNYKFTVAPPVAPQ